MAAFTDVRTDRSPSGRFIRNLALSLSGGALLTIVGAAAAHADEAGTASDGSASTGTGDATAVGNRSGTQTDQTLAPSGGGGSPQVISQTATVPNVGVAVANTGGNVATGNESTNGVTTTQTATGGALASSNSGEASNASDGRAWITTGDASAVGNESSTTLNQSAGGALGGLLVVDQDALVVNAGVGLANTGGNTATGNDSDNSAGLVQVATNPNGLATNSGATRNGSDGSATIITGAASATGNKSDTTIAQSGGGTGDGDPGGLVIIDQNALVANTGLGVANTGLNAAVGNVSQNQTFTDAEQTATIDPSTDAAFSMASNQGDLSSTSDGTAWIHTGDADAIGNDANTNVTQTAHGAPSSLGGIVTTQNAAVLNAGIGVANTGVNLAVGNASENIAFFGQAAAIGDAASDVDATSAVASNAATVANASDGTAEIGTGDASASGNRSDTELHQDATGTVDGAGLVINAQAALVANVGVGVANSGVNLALGNVSANNVGGGPLAAIEGDVDVLGPATASNSGSYTNASDGTGSVRTGDALATGNDSVTWLAQSATGTIGEGSMGVIPNVQAAAVVNAGAGLANSGINAAVGNASGRVADANRAVLQQASTIAPAAGLDIVGPATASNTTEVGNWSDGTAKVDTGDATATGNSSSTDVRQDLDATVDGMGVPVAPQLAVVANLGLAVANSGINAAVGNISTNRAGTAVADEIVAEFEPTAATTVLGPVTASNAHEATNSSDGEACVCTGDATASGNISKSTLHQDVEVTVDDGVSVVPTSGLIVNLGVGVANSGVNAAIGNASTNSATLIQSASLDPAAPPLLVGPQTIANGGGADNTSDGTGEVGTGKATATGNESTSDMDQTAVVDGAGVIAPISGSITNAGLGLANAGVNLGVGNASTNDSTVTQAASGTGTVSNQGQASNASDGTAQIGDPDCEDEKVPGKPEQPGAPTLPRTGNELETQAALALMLLLAGAGMTVAGRRRAGAA